MKRLFLILTVFLFIKSFGQVSEDKIVMAMDSFALLRPQEKSYVQTDKSNYLSGETIWFKSYMVLENKPTELSKITYVVLADELGKIVEKKMLLQQNGTAVGEFELSSGIATGNYFISSYSLWMLNFPDFITTKKIWIYNALKTSLNIPAKIKPAYYISFLPEGGQLLEGIESIMAIKAYETGQRPVEVHGKIKDNTGKEITTFKSSYDGMGVCKITAEQGKTYVAEIQWPDGSIEKKSLPPAMEEGVSISADNSNALKTFIKISRGPKNTAAHNDLILVAQQNSRLLYMAKLNIDEGLDAVAINKKNFYPGVMQVTVMNMDGKPLAERLVFVANHEIAGNISSSINTKARTKNTVSIPLPGWKKINGAVSIVNAVIENASDVQNIYSSFFLSSDLHGNIFEPYKYFINKDDSTIAHLDLLMLTNGWRRFTWPDVLSYKYSPLHYAFETSLYASGNVMQANGKTPLTSGKINLIIKGEDSTTIMSEAAINLQSQFVVDNINFKKAATLFYQGTNAKKENGIVSIKLFPSYIDTIKNIGHLIPGGDYAMSSITGKAISDAWDRLPSSAKAKTLDAVVLKTKKLSVADSLSQVYATDIFNNSDQNLAMDDGNYFDIWQYLQRNVPGISINKTDTGIQVNFSRYAGLNMFSLDGSASGVVFYLNEVPVPTEIVDFIYPGDLALVKIYKGASGIALGAYQGAIALYTSKGKSARDWRQKGFDFVKKTGFSVPREFFIMDYSKLNTENELPDIRNTLYWNTDLIIKNEKIDIEFYTDDTTKKFLLLLEGIDENGKLIHVEKRLN